MEILKRATGDAGELVPWNADKKDVQEEVNRRAAKAGFTTKYGECPYATKIQSVCDFDFLPTKINGKIIGD